MPGLNSAIVAENFVDGFATVSTQGTTTNAYPIHNYTTNANTIDARTDVGITTSTTSINYTEAPVNNITIGDGILSQIETYAAPDNHTMSWREFSNAFDELMNQTRFTRPTLIVNSEMADYINTAANNYIRGNYTAKTTTSSHLDDWDAWSWEIITDHEIDPIEKEKNSWEAREKRMNRQRAKEETELPNPTIF